jgi:hypothetical protein
MKLWMGTIIIIFGLGYVGACTVHPSIERIANETVYYHSSTAAKHFADRSLGIC